MYKLLPSFQFIFIFYFLFFHLSLILLHTKWFDSNVQAALEQRFLQTSESPKQWIQEASQQIVEATMLLKDIPALAHLWKRARGQANALLVDVHALSAAFPLQGKQ